jgi:Mn2+/Fe2+ NRAMP family transporter
MSVAVAVNQSFINVIERLLPVLTAEQVAVAYIKPGEPTMDVAVGATCRLRLLFVALILNIIVVFSAVAIYKAWYSQGGKYRSDMEE